MHFSDSAMVSRAVARGYVTVNGADVELTEDTKRQLLKVDKEASAAREKAYQDYVMQHEMACIRICMSTVSGKYYDTTSEGGN